MARRGWTALHLAALFGRGTTVGLLLKHKADIKAKNNEGTGPWKGGGLSGIPPDAWMSLKKG